MSHYAVAVFANNPIDFDDLLAPYNEQDESYYEFIPVDNDDVERKYEKYNSENLDFETWLTENDYVRNEDGRIGYIANPNAKWDWYTLDARNYLFDTKDGVDLSDYRRKNDYIYDDKQWPYAFVTPDGKWHAPGTVGWFAMDDSTDESYAEYLKEWRTYVNDNSVNPYVSFVDCHI